MIRRVLALTALALALAGCSRGDDRLVADSCAVQGYAPSVCRCVAVKLRTDLPSTTYQRYLRVLKLARRIGEERVARSGPVTDPAMVAIESEALLKDVARAMEMTDAELEALFLETSKVYDPALSECAGA